MNVFVAEPYSAESLAKLKTGIGLKTVDVASEAEALLIRSGTKIDKKFLDEAPKLKFVCTATSGFDHIDWKACVDRGVTVAHTPEANSGSTAELTLFLMSGLLRKTLAQIGNARDGNWRKGLERGDALEGKTLGVAGLGRVGFRVARLAKAYGMNVIGHDPYVEAEVFNTLGIERLGFIELLRSADILTLHVPLTRETRHLINLPTLSELQTGAYLINCSRGAVVDESEVLVALREDRLAGAAFDVLEREPPLPANELLKHPKVIVTPHVGAFTTQAFQRASMAAVNRCLAFSQNQPVSDTLPLDVPWFE